MSELPEVKLPGWFNFKVLVKIVIITAALGASYTELRLTMSQMQKDIEAQKKEIENVKETYVPLSLYQQNVQSTTETLRDIKNEVIATRREITKFK